MADVIFQQQVQLRQQRQSIEEQRRRLTSQQSLRQSQDRNVALQRQQQLKQLSQAEQQISAQDLQLQQLQQQQSQPTDNREAQRQTALRILVEKGKGSSALYSLPKEERAAIEAYASELKASRERSAGIVAVSKAEKSLASSLTPELRRDIYLQGATGQGTITLPNLSSKFQQLTQPQFTPYTPTMQVDRNRFQGPVQRFTDPQFFAETGKKRQLPLTVTPARNTFSSEFNTLKSNIQQSYQRGDLPQIVRSSLGGGTEILFRAGTRKISEGLSSIGISPEALGRTDLPISRIVGDVALGSLLVGLSGSSGQVAVSRYVKNGRVYYVDNTGQVIGSESVEQAGKNIADFKQLLDESAIFKKADSFYPNEANLRERTRELILRANNKQLKSLKELYKKSGRLDLYNDILAQERGLVIRTNTISKSVPKPVKDKPAQLTGAGQLTSQFAGTGQYERTEAVAIRNPSQPQQVNQMLGLQQTGFQFERLGMKQEIKPLTIVGTISRTRQFTGQVNNLGLKTETQTKQGSVQARTLLSLFRTAQATRPQTKQLTRQTNQLDFGKPRGRDRGRLRPSRIKLGLDLPEGSTSLTKVRTGDSFGVGIEVRRGGRFVTIGKESTLGKALMKASGFVDVNLARSFRLRSTETGELLDVSSLPIGFRRSKREAKTFVEESRFALSTGGEKGEIKYFKNVKSKRRRLI